MTRIQTTSGNYEHIKNSLFGEEVFIVGSGPSLIGYDFKRLTDKKIISVNHALFDLMKAGVIPYLHIFLDQRWLTEANIKIEELPVFSITSSNSTIAPRIGKLGVIPADNTRRTYSPDPKAGFFTPRNGICFAISVAIYMGASQINLCGADCRFVTKEMAELIAIKNENVAKAFEIRNSDLEIYGHSSSGVYNHSKDKKEHGQIFNTFQHLYEEFKNVPVKIRNLSEISYINTFERGELP